MRIHGQALLLDRLHFRVFPAEALHSAGRIEELLLASKERVASGADFQVDIALMSGPGGKRVPARAHDAYLVVSGMDFLFHFLLSFGSPGHTEPLREFPGKSLF